MRNFHLTATDFCYNALRTVGQKVIIYRRVFYTLNTISIIFTALGSILTTLVLSRQVPWLLNHNSVPDWYFFATSGFSAFVTLFAGTINFFVIREKIKTYSSKKEDIINEIIDFTNKVTSNYKDKKTREYHFYLNVALILDADLKRNEVAK